MQDGGVIEKTLTRFQWLSSLHVVRTVRTICHRRFVSTFHWADNFLFDLG